MADSERTHVYRLCDYFVESQYPNDQPNAQGMIIMRGSNDEPAVANDELQTPWIHIVDLLRARNRSRAWRRIGRQHHW